MSSPLSRSAQCFLLALLGLAFLAPSARAASGSDYWPTCSRDQAQSLEAKAKSDPQSALKAANCFAYLVLETDSGSDQKLADAKAGQAMAEKAVAALPKNAAAQYAAAVLIGEVAKNQGFFSEMQDGLKLVPQIVDHAKRAAALNPKLNDGGPFVILGEVYLDTPGPPVSIGDDNQGITYLEHSVRLAPNNAANRIRLGKGYLKVHNKSQACRQFSDTKKMPAEGPQAPSVKEAYKLYDENCR